MIHANAVRPQPAPTRNGLLQPRDPASPRVAAVFVVGLVLAALCMSTGCCSVTAHDVDVLDEAIMAERAAVVVIPGLESVVEEKRKKQDEQRAKIRAAHQ